jgi:thymidylate synthase (FAD)
MITATLLKHMGDDLDVVNAAKVSFAKESKEFDDNSVRLIKYLAKHKHMSPFGHCFASFHVKAPIFVARQLVKHKFLRWNEVSRRYVDDEPEFYQPDVWRGK